MLKRVQNPLSKNSIHRVLGVIPLALVFLIIEFFDEFHYGIQGAALPVIRLELGLSYAEIGLLLGVPSILSTVLEPAIMLLGDTDLRRRLVFAGGMAIALALVLTASAASFPMLLLAMIIAYPASGAFVSLSQATLMDQNPGREAQMMARWSVAGSLGNLLGPLVVAGSFALKFGWRWIYFALAIIALFLLLLLAGHFISAPFRRHDRSTGEGVGEPENRIHDGQNLRALIRSLWQALRDQKLMRWIVLLRFADLMLDVFTGYMALYLTDVAGLSPAQAGLFLSLLILAGLAADILLIPLLERFPGRFLVRASAALALAVYAGWLLIPWLPAKLALLLAIPFTTMGWYQVLQGEAYAALPGRSGTVMAINSLGSFLDGILVWLVGWMATQAGLPAAMWLLLLGPVSLVLFVPAVESVKSERQVE